MTIRQDRATRAENRNQPPTARAGRINASSARAGPTYLDASASSDPDNDIVGFSWFVTAGDLPADVSITVWPSRPGDVPPGGLDAHLRGSEDEVTVRVEDTTPPRIDGAAATPSCLWPPNHRYVVLRLGEEITGEVSDACSVSTTLRIVSVASDQPDNATGLGDGDTVDDVRFGPSGVCLRSERGAAHGRSRHKALRARALSGPGDRLKRLSDTPVTSSGQPAARIELRAMHAPCSLARLMEASAPVSTSVRDDRADAPVARVLATSPADAVARDREVLRCARTPPVNSTPVSSSSPRRRSHATAYISREGRGLASRRLDSRLGFACDSGGRTASSFWMFGFGRLAGYDCSST